MGATITSDDSRATLRRTKIVATLGPATDDRKVFRRMLANGLDVVRINFSHGELEQQKLRIRQVRELAEDAGQYVAILADLQGPKIRIARFVTGKVELQEGQQFIIDSSLDKAGGDATRVGTAHDELHTEVGKDDVLLLDDGAIMLRVSEVRGTAVHCEVQVGGILSDSKGLNRLGGGLSADTLTEKDRSDIKAAGALAVDYIAVSFVRSAEDVELARKLFHDAGGRGGIVSKIERAEAIDNMIEIVDASEAVMIARGDLGVEMGDAELPAIQKLIIRTARRRDCISITATQMMQSMIVSAQPTRAEVSDVANAVMDGTDAVMLSAETAIGEHPDKVIAAMDRICRGAERHRITRISRHRVDREFRDAQESIAMAAMYVANHLNVKAILAMTESGQTPKLMSRMSSGIPIIALSRHVETLRRVRLYRGVYPILWQIDPNDPRPPERQAVDVLENLVSLEDGDSLVVTFGDLTGIQGATNTIKIIRSGL
jgi:pyruvate kinase